MGAISFSCCIYCIWHYCSPNWCWMLYTIPLGLCLEYFPKSHSIQFEHNLWILAWSNLWASPRTSQYWLKAWLFSSNQISQSEIPWRRENIMLNFLNSFGSLCARIHWVDVKLEWDGRLFGLACMLWITLEHHSHTHFSLQAHPKTMENGSVYSRAEGAWGINIGWWIYLASH